MKVVIAGGYGVFGSLTARMLCRDGHSVWLAGRSISKAEALAAEIGASLLQADIHRAPEKLFAPSPDVIIDAAGPYQSYRDDPYRIPRLCIQNGCHYLDLSDAAEFTRNISSLNDEALDTGIFVLSGASSVPGLSSVIVEDLVAELDKIDVIETVILPGNRAPRGRSVIESILDGVGRPSEVLRGNKRRNIVGWTDRKTYRLAPGLKRTGYFVDVPDIHLLPKRIVSSSVMFRAGLELSVMNWALFLLAKARKHKHLSLSPAGISLFHWLSKALYVFGSDRGGMQVSVIGRSGDRPSRRTWTLVAEEGDGPFVPGIVCRAILRRADSIPKGARPCLAELTRGEVESAMSDLAIETRVECEDYPTLFEAALGDQWQRLPPEVRALHSVQDVECFSGTAIVRRGRSTVARIANWFFGFPQENTNAAVSITKTRMGHIEIWERSFDAKTFRSLCSPAPSAYRYRERFGPFTFEQDLTVSGGCLNLPVRFGWFLGIPLPKFLLPRSESREFVGNGVFHFDVNLFAPLGGGLIVSYRGSLVPDGPSNPQPSVT